MLDWFYLIHLILLIKLIQYRIGKTLTFVVKFIDQINIQPLVTDHVVMTTKVPTI